MTFLLALFLIAHGIAHLVGFVVPWGLMPSDMAGRTTVLAAAVDIGETGARVFGVLWLALAIGFLAAGAALLAGWWDNVWIVRLAALSLVFCVVGWPDTRIGLIVNVIIIVALFGFRRLGPA